jgi:hypothetical protein
MRFVLILNYKHMRTAGLRVYLAVNLYSQLKTYLRVETYSQLKTNMMVKTYLQLYEDQHSVDDLLIDLPGGEDLLTAA